MFSKRPRENIAGASLLSLCVDHFCKLQWNGNSGQKEAPIFSLALTGNRNS